MNKKTFEGSEVDPYLIVSIVVQFVVFALINLILYQLVFAPLANNNIISNSLSLFFSLWLSSLIFTHVFFKTKWREMWFIDVLDNKALIVGRHGLLADKLPETDSERLEVFKGAREIHSGLHGKFPWEYPFKTINLESEIMIGPGKDKDKPLEVVNKDKETYYIFWQIRLTPLKGYLIYLVRHSEDALKAFFVGEANGFIDRWFTGIDRKTYDQDGERMLKEAFKKHLFGGEDQIHSMEKRFGVFTNDPQITDVNWDKDLAKAAQAESVAANLSKSIRKMLEGFKMEGLELKAPSSDVLLLMSGILSGQIKDVSPFMFVGSEGLSPALLDQLSKGGGKKGK